ncbi:MAG: hypothetical protein HYT83_02335 [Candidatus Levybacteria bacterium]|nr:hypothetical protein [Candidatus Levybacteria bacterium]
MDTTIINAAIAASAVIVGACGGLLIMSIFGPRIIQETVFRGALWGILISGMGSLVMFLVFRVSFGHEVAGFLAFVLATTCLAMLISMIIAWRRAHQPNPGQEIGHSG